MSLYPYDPKRGQIIQTDVEGVNLDRGFIAHLHIAGSAAVATDVDGIHAGITLTAGSADVSTAISTMVIPRNLVIKGNASGISGNVVISGTNYQTSTITETIALNGSTVVQGNKAFASVVNIHVPAETHASTDVVTVGFGDKLGLPCLLSTDTVIRTALSGVVQANAPVVTCSSTAIESNTIKLDSALNGSDVDVHIII